MELRREDIRGMYTMAGTLCSDCLGENDLETVNEGNVILNDDADDPDNRMTCDDCGKRL